MNIAPIPALISKPDITAYGHQCTHACPKWCQSGTHIANTWIQTTYYNSNNTYNGFGGTSAASPMVAGAAALIIEMNPAITPQAVKKLLMDNAQDKGTVGRDNVWGAGLMDLGPIFQGVPVTCDLQVTSVSHTSPVQCYQPVTITVTVKNVGATSVSNFAVDFER